MKPQLFAPILTASDRAGCHCYHSQPRPQTLPTFVARNGGVPTTFARSVTGKRIPVVRWFSTMGSEYNPNRRCEEVSNRFQDATRATRVTSRLGYGRSTVVRLQSIRSGSCSHLPHSIRVRMLLVKIALF